MDYYIILKFGTRRVILRSPDGRGATYTRHLEGHSSFAFDGCDVVGSAIVGHDEKEPSLDNLLARINDAYAPGYETPDGLPEARFIGTTLNGNQLTVPES